MRNICLTIATTIALGTVTPATAATSDGDFAVYGWGARDCNTIIAVLGGDQEAQVRAQLAEWISGYISASNRKDAGVYDVTPIKSHFPLVSLAQNICANNADQLFENVVAAIVGNYKAFELSENSPIATLSHNGNSVNVNEATVRRVQEFLIADGKLAEGSADGQFGPQTAQAIEKWQSNSKLTVNGLPDMVTLFLMAQKFSQ